MATPSSRPTRWARRGSTQRRSSASGHEFLDGVAEFRPRHIGRFVLDDAGTHPHHLVEGPVRNAFAICKTAASMPPDRLGDAVEVLEEFPRSRDFPTPATPTIDISRAVFSSPVLCSSSLSRRSSRSRPTNGGSRPVGRCAPPVAATTRSARQRRSGSGLPLSCARPHPHRRSPPRWPTRVASPT